MQNNQDITVADVPVSMPVADVPVSMPAPAQGLNQEEQNLVNSNLVNQTEKEMEADLTEMGFTGEDGEELKQYLKDLQEDEEVVENLEGEKPFYKTTLGMITISVVVLIILVLVLKYTGIFDITELMNFF